MGAPRSTGRGGGVSRRGLGWLTALFAFALLFGQFPSPASADHTINHTLQQIADLERAIQNARQAQNRHQAAATQYQNAVNAANVRIGQLSVQEQSAQSDAEKVAAQVAIAEEQLAIVTFQLNETTAHLESLVAAIDEGERKLARQETIYGENLRLVYRQAQISPLEMLLSSRSLTEFADRVRMMMLIIRQDQQLVDSIRDLKEANEEKHITAEMKKQEIEGLKAQVTAQHNELTAQKARLDQLIAQTQYALHASAVQQAVAARNKESASAAAQAAQRQQQELQRRKQEAESRYAQLAASLGSGGLTNAWSGRLATWPLRGPITSYFGPRWGGFHNGVDIASPMYTPIRAAHPGLVQVTGKPYLHFGDTAEVIIIAHASNFQTLYGHMDDRVWRVTVRPGQWVTAGQIIGYVGMTGWTTGPHLHFMTLVNGRAVNPLGYLP